MSQLRIAKLRESITQTIRDYAAFRKGSVPVKKFRSAVGFRVSALRKYELENGFYEDRIVCVAPNCAPIVDLCLLYNTDQGPARFVLMLRPGNSTPGSMSIYKNKIYLGEPTCSTEISVDDKGKLISVNGNIPDIQISRKYCVPSIVGSFERIPPSESKVTSQKPLVKSIRRNSESSKPEPSSSRKRAKWVSYSEAEHTGIPDRISIEKEEKVPTGGLRQAETPTEWLCPTRNRYCCYTAEYHSALCKGCCIGLDHYPTTESK